MRNVNLTVMTHKHTRSQLIESFLKDSLIEKATSSNQLNQVIQVNFNQSQVDINSETFKSESR